MHFYYVQATLTELRRKTGKLLGAVLHRSKSVRLTQHGKAVAEIRPRPKPLSGDEFRRLWRSREPLGKDVATAVAKTLEELDAAQ
jgi:antitoxin (DNA-binding transcriptional repressor) of toxin-antitoxin stability system